MKRFLKFMTISAISLLLMSSVSGCAHRNNRSRRSMASKPVINWRKPSEKKAYPSVHLNRPTKNWLLVSIEKQRVYIMRHHHAIYTMNASTGIHNSTPRGTYRIQRERGKFFYNRSSKEGAHYWTSWKDHGIYLFHTVPTNSKGQYNLTQARQLGRKANSHGCIRLSVPDARWINHHVPVGTKVVVK